MERVFIALGSNLGDRLLNLSEATRRVARLARVTLKARSPVLETPALLAPGDRVAQPPYLNSVIEVATSLEPEPLLDSLLAVERGMGRVRTTRWGARVIDLDLVLFGDRVVQTPRLVVPHPGLASRRFVLHPLALLAPGLVHPTLGATVRELLHGVLRTSS